MYLYWLKQLITMTVSPQFYIEMGHRYRSKILWFDLSLKFLSTMNFACLQQGWISATCLVSMSKLLVCKFQLLQNSSAYEEFIFFFFSSLFRDDLPESAYKYQLLGLNLLRLLAQNKLADFHTVSFCFVFVFFSVHYAQLLLRLSSIITFIPHTCTHKNRSIFDFVTIGHHDHVMRRLHCASVQFVLMYV